MPQALAYFPDNSGLSNSNDTEQPDDSKPETWPLSLPSSIPGGDRSLCYKGIVETERVLRLAQLQDSLVDLRRFRRTLRNLRLYFKTNTAGAGQKTQTRTRAIEAGVSSRIKQAVCRYRTAYCALLELDATGDWTKEYRELRDEDNRGPLKEFEERCTGDGRYAPSWIWAAPLLTPLGEEGIVAEQEVNETARHEWMTCRARADRWVEEEELLREEMRRVLVYLEWKSRSWSGRVGVRAGSCSSDIQHGLDAYARKQANVYHELAVLFAGQWVPYLKACGLETKWTTELSWLSPVLLRQTHLSTQFSTIPMDAPSISAVGSSSSTGALEVGQRPHDNRAPPKTQCNGGNYRGSREYSSEEEKASDDEEEGESDVDGGFSDCSEPGDEPGFEYDDDYMS